MEVDTFEDNLDKDDINESWPVKKSTSIEDNKEDSHSERLPKWRVPQRKMTLKKEDISERRKTSMGHNFN